MNGMQTELSDGVRLLRVVALLWIIYLAALVVIDRVFLFGPGLPPVYYIGNAINALVVLGLAWWTWLQRWLGRAALPSAIILMAGTPVLFNHFLAPMLRGGRFAPLPPGPAASAEGLALRLLPVLIMALVLTAWQYRWRAVLIFSLGAAALNLVLFASAPPQVAGNPGIQAGVLVTMIQTVSFLVVGYFVNLIMTRLRAEEAALRAANAQLAQYASTLEELSTSRERNRLARELHDTLAHTLSGLAVQLETAKAYWAVDPAAAERLLDEAGAATRAGLQETRRALKALRASPLADLGLNLALQQLAKAAEERANLAVTCAIRAALQPLTPAQEQCIYRIAQEAINNVVHHANAHSLSIQLTSERRLLVLTVADDGMGFAVVDDQRGGHYGLPGMAERAALVGGQLVVESQPGAGTTVQLIIPGVADEGADL